MVAKVVDAIWVWQFGTAAQKATYGRFTDVPNDRSFTKDYLQTSGPNVPLWAAKFPAPAGTTRTNFTYKWPGGSAPGFSLWSVDRYHVSWPTGSGGPLPWRLTPIPTSAGPGTFPGDPGATTQAGAYAALSAFDAQGLGGVLVGVKLVGESNVLHIRAYVTTPTAALAFASTSLLPEAVRSLTVGFNRRRACQSADFTAPGAPRIYFDPERNHDAWSTTRPPHRIARVAAANGSTPPAGASTAPPALGTDDSFAEEAPFESEIVDQIAAKIAVGDFAVADNYARTKTRGSAQRAFAKVVKDNYGWECAITGIKTKEFLIASHIVPWADDVAIRTDPANGICLSVLVDKAFDAGFLTIDAGRVVHVDATKLLDDPSLLAELLPYDGKTLKPPLAAPPNPTFLQRRLEITP